MEMKQLIGTFPQEFGLRGFPNQRFRINQRASYYSFDLGAQIVLDILTSEGWQNFCREGEKQLRAELVA
jgi:hypothetical protein